MEIEITWNKRENNCNEMLFSELCEKLEKVEKTKTAVAKFNIIFNKALHEKIRGQSAYPLMRLLLPVNDSERHRYNLKQITVGKIYVKSLVLDNTSRDAQRLLCYKDPEKAYAGHGDFCAILEEVLEARVQSQPSEMTIGKVNNLLDRLADAANQTGKEAIIHEILNNFNACEQKWLMRIVFQDLKIGLKVDQILKYYSETAWKRYNECNNLRRICEEESAGATTTTGLQVFSTFSPMLAKGFPNTEQIEETEKAMRGHSFIMEVKLDGERMSCHMSNGKIMLWTRNGNDYTETYSVACKEILKSVSQQYSCILDGEICAWDAKTSKFIAFGSNRSVAKKQKEKERENDDEDFRGGAGGEESDDDAAAGGGHSDDEDNYQMKASYFDDERGGDGSPNQRLVFVVFDIVYLKGHNALDVIQRCVHQHFPRGFAAESLTSDAVGVTEGDLTALPLMVRKSILQEIVRPSTGNVDFVKSTECHDRDVSVRRKAIEGFFNTMVEGEEEGAVVKDLSSSYHLGSKSRGVGAWVKMKPEYSGLTRDLDLAVLGAYFGEGKGRGVRSFLVGVKKSDDVEDNQYLTVTKVATGLLDKERDSLRNRLQPHWVKWDSRSLPSHFTMGNAGKSDIPDVWIPPDKTVVLQVLCAELVPAINSTSGLNCRFPRIQEVRYDKYAHECLTFEQLLEINRSPRLTTQDANRKVGEERRLKKRTMTGKRSREAKDNVPDQFRVYSGGKDEDDSDNVHILNDWQCSVLESDFSVSSREMNILPCSQSTYSREEIACLLRKLGASVVGSASSPEIVVITGNSKSFQLENILREGRFDVVHFSYLLEMERLGGYCAPRPEHYLGMKPQTKTLFRNYYDALGDSYSISQTVTGLKTLFSRMDTVLTTLIDRSQMRGAGHVRKAMRVQMESEGDVLDLAEREVVHDMTTLKQKGWRELGRTLLDEDGMDILAPLLDNSYNCLWRHKTTVYVDVGEDLGSLSPPELAAQSTGVQSSPAASSSSAPATTGGLRTKARARLGLVGPAAHVKSLKPAHSSAGSNAVVPLSDGQAMRLHLAPWVLAPVLQHRGAVVAKSLHTDVTHVLLDADVSNQLSTGAIHETVTSDQDASGQQDTAAAQRTLEIKTRLRELRPRQSFEKQVVTPQWAFDCLQSGSLLLPESSKGHVVKM